MLWDFGQPEASPDLDFLNAAVLLTRVVSKPAPGRLCLDLGHKAVASEMPHPRVKLFGLEDANFSMHSEEHLVVETPRADEYKVGSVLYGSRATSAPPWRCITTCGWYAMAKPLTAGRSRPQAPHHDLARSFSKRFSSRDHADPDLRKADRR